ncbi:MAG: DUF6127 family protein [Emcibacter sp.]|nr:DUF6127 family protein [Emcibacter sp.]
MRIGSGLLQAVRQAKDQKVSDENIYLLIAQASEEGAARALAQLGLSDENAGHDISELRDLLDSWRDTKKTARQAVIRWLMRLCFSALMLGLAVKFKLIQLGQTFGQ